MREFRPLPALILATFVGSAAPLAAQPPQTLVVTDAVQVEGAVPTVRAYLDVLDADDAEVTSLHPSELTATLGKDELALARLAPFADTDEGVGYVFLVDTSASLNAELFDRIRAALGEWIADLGPADQAALVAFGSESRLVVDFTADRGRLAAGLATLAPTDAKTLLHRALLDALELGNRRDRGLPPRRAVVVLTDGADEGSGLTVDDVLAKLRGDPMPIYPIGFSQLPEPRRRAYLDVLLRFASNSGGAFYEADRTEFAAAYQAIRHAITRVWVAEFTCAGCALDGEVYRLQLNLRRAGRVLSQGIDLRMLPPASEAPAVAEPAAAAAPAAADAKGPQAATPAAAAPSSDKSERVEGTDRSRLWLYVGFAAVVAALVAWGVSRLQRRRPAEGEGTEEAATVGAAYASALPAEPLPAADPPRRVRLVVLRGSRQGREYAVTLESSAVVGARSSCNLVLSDERGIAPRQFELAQRERRVMIRNLAKNRPTLLNGMELNDWSPVKSNDLVGTGETIFRMVYH